MKALLASVACYVAAWIFAASDLPARVPIHFGTGGDPDEWTTKGHALLTFALVGAGVTALLVAMGPLSARLPTSMINMPNKAWWTATPEREALMRRRIGASMYGIAASTLFLLTAVLLLTVRAAHADPPHLDAWVIAPIAIYLVVITVQLVRLSRSAGAAPTSQPPTLPTTLEG